MQTPPGPTGLYDPRFEHDSCGVSFVANIKGVASHELVRTGPRRADQPRAPRRHRRRGRHRRRRRDPHPGPRPLPARGVRARSGVELPPAGAYAVGMAFLPADDVAAEKAQAAIETIVADEGLAVVGWRDVPVDPDVPRRHRPGGDAALPPAVRQPIPAGATGIDLDRKVFVARKRIEHELDAEQAHVLPVAVGAHARLQGDAHDAAAVGVLPRPHDERFESALLLVHSRFSTNTFPSWPLAHPYRYVAHNGEINTVQGNQNWMRAREAMLGDVGPARARAGVPDLHARRVRHGPLRRGARAAPPRRPAAATTPC